MTDAIVGGYEDHAPELIGRFEAISPIELYAPVGDVLPRSQARVLDVGAGTGRDAAWFAKQGHDVLAVEPTNGLRQAGLALHPSSRIEWLDDRLPELTNVQLRGEVFDWTILSAVWQHLTPRERSSAMPKLASLMAPAGILIMSLRQGEGAPSRPCFEAPPQDTINAGEAAGLRLVFRRSAPSVQIKDRGAGVAWTWLGFSRL